MYHKIDIECSTEAACLSTQNCTTTKNQVPILFQLELIKFITYFIFTKNNMEPLLMVTWVGWSPLHNGHMSDWFLISLYRNSLH